MMSHVPDQLLYRGQTLNLNTTPLDDYFTLESRRKIMDGFVDMSPCFRGYVANWAIRESSLFLVGISGTWADVDAASLAEYYRLCSIRGLDGVYRELPDDPRVLVELTLQHIFPRAKGSVFANWYSGTLRCPMGKQLNEPRNYDKIFERELFIEIVDGVVVGETERTNRFHARKEMRAQPELPACIRTRARFL